MLVGEFEFPHHVIKLKSTDKVEIAFQKLIRENIHAIPVQDVETEEYLGFFELSDALRILCLVDFLTKTFYYSSNLETETNDEENNTESSSDLVQLDMSLGEFLKNRSDEEVEWSPWKVVFEDEPWHVAIDLLASGYKRIPVFNSEERLTKLITQSQVVAELHKCLAELFADYGAIPDIYDISIESSGVGIKPVFSVHADKNNVSDAFAMMIAHEISAVAVVNEDGTLFSCISDKDIRLFHSLGETAVQGVCEPIESLLNKTCREFVYRERMIEIDCNGCESCSDLVYAISKDMPLREAISKLVQCKRHRIFVVDDENRPVGVISVQDICIHMRENNWFASLP